MSEAWTIQTGIDVAKSIEEVCSCNGYHCAIAGSVLMRGQSEKDLDLIIYPHTTESMRRRDLMASLKNYGVYWLNDGAKHYNDDKLVVTGELHGRRVDFFFLK